MKIKLLVLLALFLIHIPNGFAMKGPYWIYLFGHYIEFEKNCADFLLKESPNAKDLILIVCDLRVTKLQIKSIQAEYLDENPAEKQWTDNPNTLAQLRYEWTEENEKRLLSLDKEYANLRSKELVLSNKQKNDPLLPLVWKAMNSASKTKRYQDLRLFYSLDDQYNSPELDRVLEDAGQ